MKIRLLFFFIFLIGLLFVLAGKTGRTQAIQDVNQDFFFPLSLTELGENQDLSAYANINLAVLHQAMARPIVTDDTRPVISGITVSPSQVKVEIKQNGVLIQSLTTTAVDSRYSVQPRQALPAGLYELTITATDADNRLALLSNIPIQIGDGSGDSSLTDSTGGLVLGRTTESDEDITEWAQIAYLTENPPVVVITQTILPPPDWPKPTPVVGIKQTAVNVWQKLEFNLRGFWQQILTLE